MKNMRDKNKIILTIITIVCIGFYFGRIIANMLYEILSSS